MKYENLFSYFRAEELICANYITGNKNKIKEVREIIPEIEQLAIDLPDGHSKTFAQMTREEKNKISHRRQAIDKLKSFLESV